MGSRWPFFVDEIEEQDCRRRLPAEARTQEDRADLNKKYASEINARAGWAGPGGVSGKVGRGKA